MQWGGRASFTQGAAKWLWLPVHSSLLAKTPGVSCIKGQDMELWSLKLRLIILLVPFMAFGLRFGLGSGTSVSFGSAQSHAIWQPLCTSLLLHWQGWMKHGFYCYSLVQLPTTFSDAKKVCEENKGYLATVRDRYGNIILVCNVCNQDGKIKQKFLLSCYSQCLSSVTPLFPRKI